MKNWHKDIAQWRVGNTLYLSVVFTWQLKEADEIAMQHNGKTLIGGPAVKLMYGDDTKIPYDILSFHNPLATFTTRGCPNKCSFCAVPIIEGEFRELQEWKPNPVICDNNLLACSKQHFERVINSLMQFPYADFNQGLDARLLTDWHVEQLSRLKHVHLRFAFDHISSETVVHDAIKRTQSRGMKDIGVYVLIGYSDTPEDALYRLEKVREWGIRPNPMRYQPLNTETKNSYIHPMWSEEELRKMMKYYSRLRWLEHIPYDEYSFKRDKQGILKL